jgi:hypothetical protein
VKNVALALMYVKNQTPEIIAATKGTANERQSQSR